MQHSRHIQLTLLILCLIQNHHHRVNFKFNTHPSALWRAHAHTRAHTHAVTGRSGTKSSKTAPSAGLCGCVGYLFVIKNVSDPRETIRK